MNFLKLIFYFILILFSINIVFSLSVNDQDYKDLQKELLTKKSIKIIVELIPANKTINLISNNNINALNVLSSKKIKDTTKKTNNSQKFIKKNDYQYDEIEIEKVQNETIKKLNLNVKNIKKSKKLPFIVIEINRTNIADLLTLTKVKSVKKDKILFPSLLESLPIIGANTTQNNGYSGKDQTIVILDTGFEKSHDMLLGKVISEACYSTNGGSSTSLCPGGVSQSTANNSALPCSFHPNCDHGTHVAGIAIGNTSTLKGVAPNSTMVGIQVFSNIGGSLGAYTSDIILGLERAYNLTTIYNISAVSMSIGGGGYSSYCDSGNSLIKNAIDALKSKEIPTFIASGNDYSSVNITFPACISSAVSVGSTNDSDGISPFSNSAEILDILAPGSLIYSSIPGNAYQTKSGTSMATPHLAGAWSVLKSAKPDITYSELFDILNTTGTNILDSRNGITRARINVDLALAAILVPDFFGGSNVVDISINENIFENVLYNPLNIGSGSFYDKSETQSSYSLNGTIFIKNNHPIESIENILIDFSSVTNIYNVSYFSGTIGYVLSLDSNYLKLKIPDLGPGKNVTFRYNINSTNITPPINFTSSYLKNKILAGSDLEVYDKIQNNLNSTIYLNNCIYNINVSAFALDVNLSNKIYNFTFDNTSFLGSDFSNVSFNGNRSFNWNVLNSNCLYSGNNADINYILQTPNQINLSSNYLIINSTMSYKFNNSFSQMTVSKVKAFVDLDLKFDKTITQEYMDNATWKISTKISNPTNITVNLEKVTLWVSKRNGTGTGFTNPAIIDNDITTNEVLKRVYYPFILLNNSVTPYNNSGLEWIFDYTYSSSPIVWLNTKNSIIDNNIQITDSSVSFAKSENNIYQKEVYITTGYWIEISKNITRLSNNNYSIDILVENKGPSVTPPNEAVVVYNFIPNSFNLSSNFIYSNSSWYNTTNSNSTLNDAIYNGTMFQFGLLENNPTNSSLDKFVGIKNLNNSWSVSYNLTGHGNFKLEDLFLTGVDPLHVDSNGATKSIDIDSIYKFVSSSYEYISVGVAVVIGGVLFLI